MEEGFEDDVIFDGPSNKGNVYILKTFWVEETKATHLFTYWFICSFTQHLLSNDNTGGIVFDLRSGEQIKQGLCLQG